MFLPSSADQTDELQSEALQSMAEIGKQTGKARGAAPLVTPAPTRSQVNRESKAPDAGRAGKPLSGAAKTLAKPPPGPPQPAGDKEPYYGQRRGDLPTAPVKSPETGLSRREGREAGTGVESESARRPQRLGHIPAVAAEIALALICVATEPAVNGGKEESHANISLQAQPQPTTGPPQVLSAPAVQKEPTLGADEALTNALDDLNSALEAQPGLSPEELLRQVSSPDHDCMLAWHDHVPSLIFGKEPIESHSLADTLHACANAIRRMR